MDWRGMASAMGGGAHNIMEFYTMLKLAIQLIGAVPMVYDDVKSIINEIANQPRGQMHLSNALDAMKRLIADIEDVLKGIEK